MTYIWFYSTFENSRLVSQMFRQILTIKLTVNILAAIISLKQHHHWLVYSSTTTAKKHNEKDN